MDRIYEKDIAVIEMLQSRFQEYAGVFETISNLMDPRHTYLVYVPLIFSIDWKIGKKIMWAIVMVEWTSHLLKWLLHGERPYWWIHETLVYKKNGVPAPNIRQFPLTCETGPGTPSGHSQVAAAVWYIIFDSFLKKYNSGRKTFISKMCWIVYILLLAAIGISRVFIAAHFPHQCVLGLALGWLTAVCLKNIENKQFGMLYYSALTAGLFTGAFMVYELLKFTGADPMWTIEKAVKWCAKPEYIHLTTTPFYSMMRYSGFLLGMGFGFNSHSFRHHSRLHFTTFAKTACAFLSVGICLLSKTINPPSESMVYYFNVFLINSFLSYIMIAVIPTVVALLWPIKDKIT